MADTKQDLKRTAQKKLLDNPHTKKQGIEVLAMNNVITLKGSVPSAYIKDTAEILLRDLEGVDGVVNELHVEAEEENPFRLE